MYLDEGTQNIGSWRAEEVVAWPLHHELEYLCKLEDHHDPTMPS